MSAQLIRAATCQVLLIDVQDRLFQAMPESDRASVIKSACVLARTANALGLPLSCTEQYPKGLGATAEEIERTLPEHARRFEKTGFSCCSAEGFLASLKATGRRQIVIAGQEAHVCVLQTALELAAMDFQVFVVSDGVCSRNPERKRNALERMAASGVVISNVESVLFECLGDAAHPQFKALSALIR